MQGSFGASMFVCRGLVARERSLVWEGSCSRHNGSKRWIARTKIGPFKVGVGTESSDLQNGYEGQGILRLKVEGCSFWDIGFWIQV